ncbi:hypothetical protein V6N13_120810 [Hibiscus sabdariffa]
MDMVVASVAAQCVEVMTAECNYLAYVISSIVHVRSTDHIMTLTVGAATFFLVRFKLILPPEVKQQQKPVESGTD